MVRPKSDPADAPVQRRSVAGLLAVVSLVVLALGAAGCQSKPPTLNELSGVDALKAQFNADAGKPRVVLLLSPT